jgi:hypothetical protein
MDATTRWETEALRSGRQSRTTPPRPSSKRRQSTDRDGSSWVTLREAEEATGIPVNTLRKWVRKSGLASYLESDGETPVRMVDLDAVRARASELGREITPIPAPDLPAPLPPRKPHTEPRVVAADAGPVADPSSIETPEPTDSRQAAIDTMIVPIDAWNKMLNQLGNLHEAGQQLAVATERAAKAETEAAFLRERLAELRTDDAAVGTAPAVSTPAPEPDTFETPGPPHDGRSGEPPVPPTTTYWRYVTTGWRRRRRASRD